MEKYHLSALTGGLALTALCLVLRYLIGRRRFNRRGVAGLQQFRSYRHFVVTATIEFLIITAANLCGLVGLFLLAVAGFNLLKF
jgi:hypothetical protein